MMGTQIDTVVWAAVILGVFGIMLWATEMDHSKPFNVWEFTFVFALYAVLAWIFM